MRNKKGGDASSATQQSLEGTPFLDKKSDALEQFREDATGQNMTTNEGLFINDDQNALKAGERGPSLLEDHILREKISHFDHERIPERVVHARGTAAHGYFEAYADNGMEPYTKAKFLLDSKRKTPVFLRFSTVAGSRGSADLARDVRGFATRFYTDEGNFDLVGNNIPVFFIQDAIKFPDLIHAVKPEPHNEIPQAASAHDTFYDFISLVPESMHMLMWVMSDRAIPRSLRMIEGFGVHTFRLINEKGEAHFVKFHWKPLLGVHSVLWDEAQKINGKDADFHRRDLWENIEAGNFPEWEFGVQIVAEADELKYGFDLLDATKLIPEELVPVKRIGKMVLNRNVDNYFAETEQVAFHLGHLVPGIDFSNDPLLQGRLFSYTDTQLTRLGGTNFNEIPINRPVCPVHNGQRDGHSRQTINKGRVSYSPNSLGGGCPMQVGSELGGFVSYAEKLKGSKVRARSASFLDHYSQATLFFQSQTPIEQTHMIGALSFELSNVETVHIRERMLAHLSLIDATLASGVAENLGMAVPDPEKFKPLNQSVPADALEGSYQSSRVKSKVKSSPSLSIIANPGNVPSIKTRKIAVLLADGFDEKSLSVVHDAVKAEGGSLRLIAPRMGDITSAGGKTYPADYSLLNAASVVFDAVLIAGGAKSAARMAKEASALHFINETFKHCKAIAALGEGEAVLQASAAGAFSADDKAIVVGSDAAAVAASFIKAISGHRNWDRKAADSVPA